MAIISDITKGIALKHNNEIWSVMDYTFVNPGKGSAFYRVRMKNIKSGKTIEFTFKSGETIEIVDTEMKRMQFLFADKDQYTFMDNTSYEQVIVNRDMIEPILPFLKESQEATLVLYEGNPIAITLPKKIILAVTSTPPGVKGDTATGGTKLATLETGAQIPVPLFIKEGDKLVINTETGAYVERSTE